MRSNSLVQRQHGRKLTERNIKKLVRPILNVQLGKTRKVVRTTGIVLSLDTQMQRTKKKDINIYLSLVYTTDITKLNRQPLVKAISHLTFKTNVFEVADDIRSLPETK